MQKPYQLNVKQKTGFRNVSGNPVVIYDERGIPFYDTREQNTKVLAFNLPKGKYLVERGRISEMVSPLDFDLLPLPLPERNKRGIPENFETHFGENPYTATIFWDERAMLMDNKLKSFPLPKLMAVFYHECGHKFYKTEEFCDKYAYNKMIEAGYNPSQIQTAFVETLSKKQLPRKNALVHSVMEPGNDFDHYDHADNFDLSAIRLKYVYNPAALNVYEKPGGKLLYTTTPGGWAGKVYGSNTAGTWIDITPAGSTSLGGTWIINGSGTKFNDHLTEFQKQDFANRYAGQTKTYGDINKIKLNESLASSNAGFVGSLEKLLSGAGEYVKLIVVGVIVYGLTRK